MEPANPITGFYANEMEKDRLETEEFMLEGIRTKEIISRYLEKSPMKIADIGGGAGFYSFWLQAMGHQVNLVDLTPGNIELAKAHAEKSGIALAGYEVGDATHLQFGDHRFDLVLLLGPLYHLVEREERIKAFSEARRILKPGGRVLAAVISRYASVFDGFKRDLVADDAFFDILVKDLETGVHLNRTGNPEYFTTAYFHSPEEARQEALASGLTLEKLVAVESFGWIVGRFAEKSSNRAYMDKLSEVINKVESKEDLLAMSPHIIVVGRKGG